MTPEGADRTLRPDLVRAPEKLSSGSLAVLTSFGQLGGDDELNLKRFRLTKSGVQFIILSPTQFLTSNINQKTALTFNTLTQNNVDTKLSIPFSHCALYMFPSN